MWGRTHSSVRRAKPGSSERASRHLMRNIAILALSLVATLALLACSPRDFLTRRLATDLLSASDAFKTPQQFALQTGVISNKDYVNPEYLVLQQHGWISATTARCAPGMVPSPCWDVLLTPSGVETVRSLVSAEEATKASLQIPVARRELLGVTGISKQGNVADVEFSWKWVPLNEIGAALYSGELRYTSTVGFRQYDDGWRLMQSAPRSAQTLDDAFKNAEPAQ